VLFLGLLCLIGPLLFGRDYGWRWPVWTAMLLGLFILAAFLAWELRLAAQGGLPLLDLALLRDAPFMNGLGAAFCFFFANLSFYLVTTLYLQNALGAAPLRAAATVLPLAIAFVVGAQRSSGETAPRRGCLLQLAGLAGLGLVAIAIDRPSLALLALPLMVFGYGQGLVMAPLSGAVLRSVPAAHAGAGAGLYGTVTQIGNAAGIAIVGGTFFAIAERVPSQAAALIGALGLAALAILACRGLLARTRR
jgi:hypothetical protein